MGESFDVKQALQIGLLPSAVTRSHPVKYLESHTQMYIKEELAQEGISRNLEAFTRKLQTYCNNYWFAKPYEMILSCRFYRTVLEHNKA